MKKAFTLIELLVVIAIVGLIGAVMFPVLGRAREAGRRAQCANNLRQHGMAWYMYLDDHDDRFPLYENANPPSDIQCNTFTFGGKTGSANPYDTYTADMRPLNRYLEVDNTSSADIFHCPDDTRPALGGETIYDYYGNSYSFNLHVIIFSLPRRQRPLKTITSSHDRVFLERCSEATSPGHGEQNWPNTPVMVLFVDGHVKGPFKWISEVDESSTGVHPERPVYYYPNTTPDPID